MLETNWHHLRSWIPARIATPAPVLDLAERLAGFAADFAADREWRFAMFTHDDAKLLGEVALFPRSATGRVHVGKSDRAELGYWLRADETGKGFATEAARALLSVAERIPAFSHIEIRCDARNLPSAGVPQRLGFILKTTIIEPTVDAAPVHLQVWVSELRNDATP